MPLKWLTFISVKDPQKKDWAKKTKSSQREPGKWVNDPKYVGFVKLNQLKPTLPLTINTNFDSSIPSDWLILIGSQRKAWSVSVIEPLMGLVWMRLDRCAKLKYQILVITETNNNNQWCSRKKFSWKMHICMLKYCNLGSEAWWVWHFFSYNIFTAVWSCKFTYLFCHDQLWPCME